jgi:hypothetical protein
VINSDGINARPRCVRSSISHRSRNARPELGRPPRASIVSTLWRHLARRLIPTKPDDFETVATLLMLAYTATAVDAPVPREQVAAALSELGWRHNSGRPIEGYEIYGPPAYPILINVTAERADLGGPHILSEFGCHSTLAGSAHESTRRGQVRLTHAVR